jgi:hypothetical protein
MTTYVPTAQDTAVSKPAKPMETRSPSANGPVLIADCTTAVAGETLLSALWRRWDRDSPQE